MSEWKQYSPPMIPGVSEAMSAAQQAAGVLGSLLDVLAELLSTLAELAGMVADPMEAAVASLIQVVQELVDLIVSALNSGVYFFVDKGPLFCGGKPDGLEGFLSRFESSFNDPGDAARPQFGSGSSVSALIFLVGGDDPSLLLGPFASLGSLFGIPALKLESQEQLLDYPVAVEQSLSTPPDWRSVRLGQALPPFEKLGGTLQQVVDLLAVGDSYAKALQDLAQLISDKAAALEALGDEIQATLDELQSLVEAEGLYVLQVEAEGIPALIQAVRDAEDVPPWGDEAYVAGVCLLGGTADFGPVLELLGG